MKSNREDQRPDEARPILVLVFTGALTLFCALIALQAAGIPPSRHEPIGPGPVPLVLATAISLMSAVVFMASLRQLLINGLPSSIQWPEKNRVVILGLILLYAAVLQLDAVRYDVVTAIFLFVMMAFLGGLSPRRLLVFAILSVFLGFLIQLIFTRFFVVDLPGVF